MRYDVVVVGAGSAGCVVAARLSEDPSREILLVEAGPDHPTRTQWPLDIADPGRLPSNHARDHDRAFSSVDSAHRTGPVPLVRGRVVGLVDPVSTGELWLGSADPAAPPRIDPGWLTDPDGRDLHRLVSGVQQLRRILDHPRFGSYVGGSSGVTSVPDDAELAAAIRQSVRTYHHPVGTCRMGPEPDAGAVVDARGRVHGVEGLVVADASIMPRIPRANTDLPTMMLAERKARNLTGQQEPIPAARSTA